MFDIGYALGHFCIRVLAISLKEKDLRDIGRREIKYPFTKQIKNSCSNSNNAFEN